MKTRHFFTLVIITLTVLISSCKIYYIPIDSFKQQLSGLDSSKFRTVTTVGPIGDRVTYKTYPIDYVKCIDRNGNQFVLQNSPALEIRFTDNQNKRITFYFDRIFVNGDVVTGSRSRIISSIKSTVHLSDIKKIEIQSGGKRFSYVK